MDATNATGPVTHLLDTQMDNNTIALTGIPCGPRTGAHIAIPGTATILGGHMYADTPAETRNADHKSATSTLVHDQQHDRERNHHDGNGNHKTTSESTEDALSVGEGRSRRRASRERPTNRRGQGGLDRSPQEQRSASQELYPTPGVLRLPILHGKAACVDRPDLDWDEGTDLAENRRVCRRCEVRDECLEIAMANQEPYGVWAGLSVGQRRALAKRRGNAEPDTLPPHGDNSRYCRHHCRCEMCQEGHAAYERERRARLRERRRNEGKPSRPASPWSTHRRDEI